jgi:exosortase
VFPPTPTTTSERARTLRSIHVGLLALFVVGAFVAAYGQIARMLTSQWSTNDTYSFGVLVPFISGYLIWIRRETLTRLPLRPSLIAGGSMVFAAAAMLVIGRLTALIDIQEISLVLMLMGLVCLCCGLAVLRQLWLPLAYLLLMLPVWEVLTDRLHQPSQLFSASIASLMLSTIGVPVYHDGVFVSLPNITLEVASACSGINFLIAVIAMGIPQAYLYLRGWLPRALTIALAMAIALLSNGLRVAIIGVLSYYHLSESVHGPGHILQGLFVSSFGFIALIVGVRIMARRYPRSPDPHPGAPRTPASIAPRQDFVIAGICATAVLALVAVYRPDYSSLPNHEPFLRDLGATWRQVPGRVVARFVDDDAPIDLTARRFQAATGERVELFVGNLAESTSDGHLTYRSVALPPDVTTSRLALSSNDGGPIEVNRAVVPRGDTVVDVLFWYDMNGSTTSYGRTAKAYASAHLLTRLGTLPRLVVVAADRPRGAAQRSDLLADFVNDVSRALNTPQSIAHARSDRE